MMNLSQAQHSPPHQITKQCKLNQQLLAALVLVLKQKQHNKKSQLNNKA